MNLKDIRLSKFTFMIETSRLYLVEFDNLQDFILLNRDVKVMKLIKDGSIKTEYELEEEFKKNNKLISQGLGMVTWKIIAKEEKKFVGSASLKPIPENQVSLGYRFFSEYWGKGFATEIAKGLIDYAFNQLHLKKMVATARQENTSSIRILEKTGMKFERTVDYFYPDEVLYSIKNLEK